MIIPEVQLFNLIESLIQKIKDDLKNNTDEKKTFLYHIFNGVVFGKLKFFDLAKEFFSRKIDHPRQLLVRLGFDSDRAKMPTIHLTLPSERTGQNGIGVDEGYAEALIDTVEKKYTPVYTRVFETQYTIIITSDNMLEVIILYNLFKSLLISIFDSVELGGFRNLKISGQDIQLNSDLVPINVFSRGIMLDFFYELSVKKILSEELINEIIFEGALKSE